MLALCDVWRVCFLDLCMCARSRLNITSCTYACRHSYINTCLPVPTLCVWCVRACALRSTQNIYNPSTHRFCFFSFCPAACHPFAGDQEYSSVVCQIAGLFSRFSRCDHKLPLHLRVSTDKPAVENDKLLQNSCNDIYSTSVIIILYRFVVPTSALYQISCFFPGVTLSHSLCGLQQFFSATEIERT